MVKEIEESATDFWENDCVGQVFSNVPVNACKQPGGTNLKQLAKAVYYHSATF
jgi:hypothetical protein